MSGRCPVKRTFAATPRAAARACSSRRYPPSPASWSPTTKIVALGTLA